MMLLLALTRLTNVAVGTAHERGQLQCQVLLEVGRTVELTRVHVTDDDANLRLTDARVRNLPGLQTDAVLSLLALLVGHLERVGQLDGGDDALELSVGGLGESNHESSSGLLGGVSPLLIAKVYTTQPTSVYSPKCPNCRLSGPGRARRPLPASPPLRCDRTAGRRLPPLQQLPGPRSHRTRRWSRWSVLPLRSGKRSGG
jgi:hypothetical protein